MKITSYVKTMIHVVSHKEERYGKKNHPNLTNFTPVWPKLLWKWQEEIVQYESLSESYGNNILGQASTLNMPLIKMVQSLYGAQ